MKLSNTGRTLKGELITCTIRKMKPVLANIKI